MNTSEAIQVILKAVFSLAAIGYIGYQYMGSVSPNARADHTMEATALSMSARGNQASVHVKYEGKTIEMTGKVYKVTMAWRIPVVSVGLLWNNIDCHLSILDTQQAGRLQQGDAIRVKGVASVSGSTITLKRCTIV